jgi:FKBP-type peptidyl-prolyl cis-trans isomerase FkpA
VKQLFACVAVALLAVACNSDGGGSPTDPSQVNVEFSTTDLVVGTGAQAAAGNAVTVHYTGWLYNPAGPDSKGTQFDTSLDGDAPLQVVIGVTNIIPGFQQGLLGMQVGGRRRMYIPPSLAYGSSGSGGVIPPNASLVFEVEMTSLVQ